MRIACSAAKTKAKHGSICGLFFAKTATLAHSSTLARESLITHSTDCCCLLIARSVKTAVRMTSPANWPATVRVIVARVGRKLGWYYPTEPDVIFHNNRFMAIVRNQAPAHILAQMQFQLVTQRLRMSPTPT